MRAEEQDKNTPETSAQLNTDPSVTQLRNPWLKHARRDSGMSLRRLQRKESLAQTPRARYFS